jgi:ubiquitin conjugation factor E4 B
LEKWESETIRGVFNVTLERSLAEARDWEVVWLKDLSNELLVESPSHTLPPLSADVADRCLISRLGIDPQSEDPEILPVIASLPLEQTTFEYLVSCWQQINSARIALHKRSAQDSKDASTISKADAVLDQLRDLVISYAGFTLQDPTIFPQPKTSKPLGIQELAMPLLAMSGATPLGSSVSTSLQPHEVEPFIRDLAKRFEGDDLESTFGESLVNEIVAVITKDTGGLASSSLGTQSWRAGVSALDALTAVKSLAAMVRFSCLQYLYAKPHASLSQIPRLSTWVLPPLTGPTLEHRSLIGPIARLGIFAREWVNNPLR